MAPTELRRPITDAEWEAYHNIRRTVLFERRGFIGVYDAVHPDEAAPGNHPLLLLVDGDPVGTIRVDLSADVAIFRRVAVREAMQRRGHGRSMVRLAERFARERGTRRVLSHVDRGAIEFYERCGYVREPGGDTNGATVLMSKDLEARVSEER